MPYFTEQKELILKLKMTMVMTTTTMILLPMQKFVKESLGL